MSAQFWVWFVTSPTTTPYPETYPQMVLKLQYVGNKLVPVQKYESGNAILDISWGATQADKVTNNKTQYVKNVNVDVTAVKAGKTVPNWNEVSGTINITGPLGGVGAGTWVDAAVTPASIPFTCTCQGNGMARSCGT